MHHQPDEHRQHRQREPRLHPLTGRLRGAGPGATRAPRTGSGRPPEAPGQTGFTFVELVVTLIIVGILAVVVLPRFADRRAFDTQGFADQTRAAIGLARKAAVAQRRNVCVAFAPAAVTLSQATAPGAAAACTVPLSDPASGNPLVLAAPPGISLTASGDIVFNGLGEPLGGGVTVTVSGDGSRNLVVEQGTGHVR